MGSGIRKPMFEPQFYHLVRSEISGKLFTISESQFLQLGMMAVFTSQSCCMRIIKVFGKTFFLCLMRPQIICYFLLIFLSYADYRIFN